MALSAPHFSLHRIQLLDYHAPCRIYAPDSVLLRVKLPALDSRVIMYTNKRGGRKWLKNGSTPVGGKSLCARLNFVTRGMLSWVSGLGLRVNAKE